MSLKSGPDGFKAAIHNLKNLCRRRVLAFEQSVIFKFDTPEWRLHGGSIQGSAEIPGR
jgi:hypothetical protein